MRHDILELDTWPTPGETTLQLTQEDFESIRLLLSGGSVIDWHKGAFRDLEGVDRLLRQHLLNLDDPMDRRRLAYLYREAVAYVEDFRGIRLDDALRDPADVREVFLWASNAAGFRRRQVLSCMILKLMHLLNHLEAADLRTRVSAPEQMLHALAHQRVLDRADAMRRAGVPLQAFYGSRKTRASVISKLLAKRDNVAATIFDKLRYRIVVPHGDDLVPALVWLVRHGFPFNRIIPGQSHNNLLDPADLEAMLPATERDDLQRLEEEVSPARTTKNEFSGSSYRMINFIADIPVRLPEAMLPTDVGCTLGRVVYVMAELQIVDAPTAEKNEEGENAHALYKARQHDQVGRRLVRGLN
jgi:uncharacterized protein (TIGR04552 family)